MDTSFFDVLKLMLKSSNGILYNPLRVVEVSSLDSFPTLGLCVSM